MRSLFQIDDTPTLTCVRAYAIADLSRDVAYPGGSTCAEKRDKGWYSSALEVDFLRANRLGEHIYIALYYMDILITRDFSITCYFRLWRPS